MYAYQFQDATYRIDMMTRSREAIPALGSEGWKLFCGVYATRAEANRAIERIRELRP